jgi:hypothetical protein
MEVTVGVGDVVIGEVGWSQGRQVDMGEEGVIQILRQCVCPLVLKTGWD